MLVVGFRSFLVGGGCFTIAFWLVVVVFNIFLAGCWWVSIVLGGFQELPVPPIVCISEGLTNLARRCAEIDLPSKDHLTFQSSQWLPGKISPLWSSNPLQASWLHALQLLPGSSLVAATAATTAGAPGAEATRLLGEELRPERMVEDWGQAVAAAEVLSDLGCLGRIFFRSFGDGVMGLKG